MFEIITALLAVLMLVAMAFPKYFLPGDGKSKKVGSSYWGVYQGSEVTDTPAETTINVPKPARKWRVIAGSSQYASGKGTSFRR